MEDNVKANIFQYWLLTVTWDDDDIWLVADTLVPVLLGDDHHPVLGHGHGDCDGDNQPLIGSESVRGKVVTGSSIDYQFFFSLHCLIRRQLNWAQPLTVKECKQRTRLVITLRRPCWLTGAVFDILVGAQAQLRLSSGQQLSATADSCRASLPRLASHLTQTPHTCLLCGGQSQLQEVQDQQLRQIEITWGHPCPALPPTTLLRLTEDTRRPPPHHSHHIELTPGI